MRFFFRLFKVNKKLTLRIAELEKKISFLEASITEFQHTTEPESNSQPTNSKERVSPPTFLIEQLKVDQIVIHHVDYANNFGQLGIKELSGRLNIGTNYEGELSDKISQKINEKLNEKLGSTAKVNLRAKKEEPS